MNRPAKERRQPPALLLCPALSAVLFSGCAETAEGTDTAATETTAAGDIQTGGTTQTTNIDTYTTKEIWVDNDGNDTHRLVIFAHELGESHEAGIPYAERAAKVYPDASFHTIENGGHGFYGQPFEDAVQYIGAFLSEHMPVTQ